jgi:hypothetical protein
MAGSSPMGSPASSKVEEAGTTEVRVCQASKVDRVGVRSMSCNKKSNESGRGLEAANGK